jgi:hypothetical protein
MDGRACPGPDPGDAGPTVSPVGPVSVPVTGGQAVIMRLEYFYQ